MPRWIEPIASRNTLPCSSLMSVASSFWCFSISSRNLLRTRARRTGGVSRHAGNAATAALTAAFTSAAFANGTVRMTCPVAGFVTSPERELVDVVGWPLIQSGTRVDMDSSGLQYYTRRHETASTGLACPRRVRVVLRGITRGPGAAFCRPPRGVSEILGREVARRRDDTSRRRSENRRHL